MKSTKPILIISVTLNIVFFLFATAYVEQKGGLAWVVSKLPFFEQNPEIPKLPLPNVDDRILIIGDSHLAIHPWAEYSQLPFSNRAVSGSKIRDIKLEDIEGNPAIVMVSSSTNDIQEKNPLNTEEIKIALKELFYKISSRWPDSKIIFISAPYPNVSIYEKFIRAKYPNINRPMPEQIDSIQSFVSSLGIITIKAKSANIDGLHIDKESALDIVKAIEKLFANHRLHSEPATARVR